MPFNIQGPELIVLLIIALLVLGPGKLPEVGSALGKSIREFRKAASDVKDAATIEPANPDSTSVATTQPAQPAAATAQPAAPAQPTPAPVVSAEAPTAAGPDPVAAAPAGSDSDSSGS